MTDRRKIEELIESLKRFVSTNYELNKLEAIKRSAVIGPGLVSGLLLGIVAILFVFFISLGAGFYLSEKLGNSYSGFAITAAFYLLVGFIVFFRRKRLIERPLRDKIIERVFSKIN